MAIRTGTHLGPYEITSLIGAGGMGEVYQAHDTNLDRDVAIKVLPEQFARHPERLARFQREAKMLAALNHPNIATIYGLDESNGTHYLVMELVPGDTLAQRIKRNGAMPITEALTAARQIAEALEAAHNSEKGIIHRDLKPANVKVTPDGKVKVLDFGLAKAFSPEVSSEDFSNSPTLSMAATQQGVILGTAAYMSPEQARGKEVDRRTDIWAFGCVLYEMLSARPAFDGETLTDTLAAIVGQEPNWRKLPETTPNVVRRLLQRCLEKDASRRLRDIGDARIEIDDSLSAPATEPPQSEVRVNIPKRWGLVGLASVVAGVVIALAIILNMRGRAESPAGASPNVIATQLTNYGGSETAGVLSPDGKSFAFVSNHGGTPDIWLRQVSGGEPVRLTNDAAEEADLAYAPDGETIFYTRIDDAETAIWHIGVLGGQPQKLLDGAQKPAPSPDGRYLAYLPSAAPAADGTGWVIMVNSLSGGGTQTLVRGIPQGYGAPRPAWSPDGRWLAYTAGALFGPDGVFVVDTKTGQQRQVAQLPQGSNDSGQPAWLPDSRHLVVPYLPLSRLQGATDLGILDVQNGSISRLTTTVADGFTVPSVSANGSRLMVTSIRRVYELWKVPLGPDPDANGRAAVRLLDDSAAPLWSFVSRDGRTLLFNSPLSGSRNLWTMPVQGGVLPRQITAIPGDAVSHSSLSPDGARVAFASIAAGHSDIWVQNVDGSNLRQLTNDEPADSWPVWSPDGQWVAYISYRDSRMEAWRVPSAGGPPEKFPDGPERGDWIRQPNGNGTWAVRGGSTLHLVDVERHAVVWSQANTGGELALPMFSPDARFVSAPFREARDHDAVRIFDVSTGKWRVAVRLPFHVIFRADWVDNGRTLVVNGGTAVTHIVLFDQFWTKQDSR